MKAYLIKDAHIMIGARRYPRSGIFIPGEGYLCVHREENKIIIGDLYTDGGLLEMLKEGIYGKHVGKGNLYDLSSESEEFNIPRESVDLLINSANIIKREKISIESAIKEFLKK